MNQVADTIMKSSGATRIPAVAYRIWPKRTLTRILMKSKKQKMKIKTENRNLESRNNFSFLLSRFLLSALAFAFCFLLSQFLLLPSFAQTNITPAQYLASQPKPNFATGHHLPLLSIWSAPDCSFALSVEMATNWGYALPVKGITGIGVLVSGGGQGGIASALTNPASVVYQEAILCSNYPGKFKLEVLIDRDIGTNISAGFWVTNSSGYFVNNLTNTWLDISINYVGANWQYISQYHGVVSPEAPYSDLTNEAAYQVAPFSVISSNFPNAPIAIILNGGERDMSGVSGGKYAWQFDPRVIAALGDDTNFPGVGPSTWERYSSQRKGYQLGVLASAVRTAVPNRQLYIYYKTSNEQNRNTALPSPGHWGQDDTNSWWNTYDQSCWWSSYLMGTNTTGTNSSNGVGSDLPSFEDYYGGMISWTNIGSVANGYQWDLLTKHLNAVGYDFTLGYTNNCSWLCGGWSNTDTNSLSDIPTYTGFLKCLYTAGMVGGVAGYFSYPTGTVASIFGEYGFHGTFPTNIPPHWLLQIMALSHVHTLFSHLDNFLYNGDLLSGPQPHAMSADQPAYEFTNTVADPYARVLARKLRGQNQWIVTAWNAYGTNRNVTVNIPTVGALTVLAADSGSVYQVTMSGTNVQQTLLDEYGSFPKILAPPINVRVLSK